MKTFALVLILVCSIACASFGADKPVAGKPYTLLYDPLSSGILSDANQIWVVYAFDYWGTRIVQKLRGERGEGDLFQNVLYPDEGRSAKVKMARHANLWKAEILIPAEAALLSYYYTDGTRNDFNDRKTYVSYVYNESGDPVRGARFRNVDFLIMSGKGLSAILEEIRTEIEHYPDQFTAHVVYWRFRFFDTISPDTLSKLVLESDRHFEKLYNQFGDTVLNYKVLSLNDINRIVQLSLRDRLDEPPVADLIKTVNSRIIKSIEAIPPGKRLPRLAQIAALANSMLQSPQEREERDREARRRFDEMFGEFVRQPAPDFSFETIKGEKHRLSEFRGRYVLLDFWGSWCGPCLQEIPNLVQVYEEFRDRGLVMISISNDASASKWDQEKLADYAKKKGMSWTQVLDDPDNTIHKLYRIQFWPNLFLIDREGKVLQRQGLRGEEIMKTLSALLGK
jgi:thiol-disulfide isomerase/thioredoxin